MSWQRAVSVPLGRVVAGGGVLLEEGVEVPGVVWEAPAWTLADTGLLTLKQTGQAARGVQYFGLVDEDGVFRPLPDDKEMPVTLDQVSVLYVHAFSNLFTTLLT